ncbi:hypothetical protein PSENEW3_00004196 [Picochlorum sp. SENEW3]|nr:hypothetical protein PSENEW3_00004196 [Picochlorum sp. SENEW3]
MAVIVPYVPSTAGGRDAHNQQRRLELLESLIRGIDHVLDDIENKIIQAKGVNVAVLERVMGKECGLLESLESFLAYAPRPFDRVSGNPKCWELETELYSKVFVVLKKVLVDVVGLYSRGQQELVVGVLGPLLTVVCLFDVASLYYVYNQEECGQLITAMLELGGPSLERQVCTASEEIAQNLSTGAQMLAEHVSGGRDHDIVDGVAYVKDACLTLCCVMGSSLRVRRLFVETGFHMVQALDQVHDGLIPRLYFYAQQQSKATKEFTRDCSELEHACEKAMDLLLSCFLELWEEDSGGAGGSSGVNEASIRQGEMLMHSLCILGGREGLYEEAGDAMGRALAKKFNLGGRIQEAMERDVVYLDDAQKEYVTAILGTSSIENISEHVEDTSGVEKMALVSRVTEILPDFGAGFVALCLDALGNDPEKVIDALLSGAPPQAVEGVDTSLNWEGYMAQVHGNRTTNKETPEEFPELPQKKAAPDAVTSKFLDTIESSYKDRLRSSALAMQWEYEDEYDDEYDDVKVAADTIVGESDDDEVPKDITPTNSVQKPKQTKGKGSKLWILDGRVYNYPKPGSKEVSSQAEADAVLAEQKLAQLEIHGLGPGGNAKNMAPSGGPAKQSSHNSGRGRGRGRVNKEKNKAAIGNHHRKDRAKKKMDRSM